MTYEEKVIFLNNYRHNEIRRRNIDNQLETVRAAIESAKSQRLTDMPKAHGKQSDLSSVMVQLEELEDKLVPIQIELLMRYSILAQAIADLTDVHEQSIIQLRYVYARSWESIMHEVGYSWKQMFRIHKNAVRHLEL